MNLVVSVREYIGVLVHSSVRPDPLIAASHRRFIAQRLIGPLAAFAALPLYLVLRGTPSAIEGVILGSLLAPIAIACFLSRTGRYEVAQLLSAFVLAAVVVVVSAMSGGILSPAAIWLAMVPLEAALCASRRVTLAAVGFALLGACVLLMLGPVQTSVIAEQGIPPATLAAISLASALAYAALLASGAEFLARTGSKLLQLEENRYRLLAANMTDVISRHGRNGVVLFISPAAERLFAASAAELEGHGLFDRVHVADRPAYLTALAEAALGGAPRSVEFRVRRNGFLTERSTSPQFIWVEMRCQPVCDDSVDPSHPHGSEVVAVMRDVTDRKQQEEAVEDARSEAEQANAAKSRFLATMSHELRTPLNAVIGFSEMLMNESTLQIGAERRLEYARLIHDSGHHLLSVVNLVLDMSKIESGNFVITPEPFAPAPVIRNCCDLLALKARDVGLDILFLVDGELPEITADKRALKQMLLNLLSNAIKFTASGGTVTVSAAADEARISIAVQDTGVGIGAEDLARVGDPFFQVRASYDRPYEGTGLGLSIVKGLVGLHGGNLKIESRLGAGTCVTIQLPLDCEKGGMEEPSSVVELSEAVRTTVIGTQSYGWTESQVKKSA